MRSFLLAAFSILLLAEISCSPARSGNRMVAFAPDRQSARYRAVNHITHNLTAIIKDDVSGMPISSALVELYVGDYLIEPLMTTATTARGKFNFMVKEGVYTIVVSHDKYKEWKVLLPVKGWDIDLSEIRLTRFFD